MQKTSLLRQACRTFTHCQRLFIHPATILHPRAPKQLPSSFVRCLCLCLCEVSTAGIALSLARARIEPRTSLCRSRSVSSISPHQCRDSNRGFGVPANPGAFGPEAQLAKLGLLATLAVASRTAAARRRREHEAEGEREADKFVHTCAIVKPAEAAMLDKPMCVHTILYIRVCRLHRCLLLGTVYEIFLHSQPHCSSVRWWGHCLGLPWYRSSWHLACLNDRLSPVCHLL